MDITNYFKTAIDRKASDLHLVAGCCPAIRVRGELEKIGVETIDNKELEEALFSMISEKNKEKFRKDFEADFSLHTDGSRFRVNLHYQKGKIGMTARLVPEFVPGPDDLRFDEIIYQLTHLNDGLVLITGPTGSGKSTTLAAMIDIINQERKAHIITIEDPIEYIIKERQCLIEQRELGIDTKSFAAALKYALRQDPNVIMVGEMRDVETISAALTAAETGHLVLSTLHTSSAAETLQRIIDVFPEEKQKQVSSMLASHLRAIIAQELLPRKEEGMVAAREILINNRAIANLIRTNKPDQINSVIQTSKKEGMITMNKAIENLLKEGVIAEDVAKNRIRNLDTEVSLY